MLLFSTERCTDIQLNATEGFLKEVSVPTQQCSTNIMASASLDPVFGGEVNTRNNTVSEKALHFMS